MLRRVASRVNVSRRGFAAKDVPAKVTVVC
jgi:hypothetical protein